MVYRNITNKKYQIPSIIFHKILWKWVNKRFPVPMNLSQIAKKTLKKTYSYFFTGHLKIQCTLKNDLQWIPFSETMIPENKILGCMFKYYNPFKENEY